MDHQQLDQASRLIELERAQIGHEIHDALLPLIFAASAGVAGMRQADPDESSSQRQQRLQQVADWLDQALQTGRQLLTEVYPPELTGTLWTRAAKETLQRMYPQSAAGIHWQLDPAVDDIAMPSAVAAYRIVIEAVRNAMRHGQADQVQVQARHAASGFEITIRDNGRGFDPTTVPPDRFGVRSMSGRAELVGGKLTLQSHRGGPTIVTFTLPG